jgi:hypothetical protein
MATFRETQEEAFNRGQVRFCGNVDPAVSSAARVARRTDGEKKGNAWLARV